MNSPLIYVADDDRQLCANTSDYLGQHGFLTRCFFDLSTLESGLRQKKCDLVLLDRILPDGNGLDFIHKFKEQAIKVIILSAFAEETDLVVGLEVGAEDYIRKPFSLRELLARIRVALRRTPVVPQPAEVTHYRFSGWEMQCHERLLIDPLGKARNLSGAEFRLLSYFLERPHKLVERENLYDLINSSNRQVSEQALGAQISRLRACFGESAKSQRLIRTSRGDGYVFTSDVEKEFEDG